MPLQAGSVRFQVLFSLAVLAGCKLSFICRVLIVDALALMSEASVSILYSLLLSQVVAEIVSDSLAFFYED